MTCQDSVVHALEAQCRSLEVQRDAAVEREGIPVDRVRALLRHFGHGEMTEHVRRDLERLCQEYGPVIPKQAQR